MKINVNALAALFIVLSLLGPIALAAAVDDDTILEKVRQRLNNDPDVKGSTLTIEVKNGVVTLKGTVTAEKYRSKAEKLTRKVSGVKNVVNNLTVGLEKPRR